MKDWGGVVTSRSAVVVDSQAPVTGSNGATRFFARKTRLKRKVRSADPFLTDCTVALEYGYPSWKILDSFTRHFLVSANGMADRIQGLTDRPHNLLVLNSNTSFPWPPRGFVTDNIRSPASCVRVNPHMFLLPLWYPRSCMYISNVDVGQAS